MKSKSLTICVIVIYVLIGCSKEGPIGKKSLIDMAIEAKGVNCSSGGYKVLSGIDLNDNNVLDEIEIQNTKFICNGNNGTNSLLNISPESSGANCSSGGYKVTTGIDQNNNNTLDIIEIQKTEYICNGVNGVNGTNGTNGINGNNSLMNVIPELTGINCSSGGFKINSGIDLNNNGTLDTNEIQSTQFICNGTDGGYDRKVTIYFDNSFNSPDARTTAWKIQDREWIQDFDISSYLNIDSIAFGIYLITFDINSSIYVELFDMTHNTAIDHTLLNSNSLIWEWKSTTKNFLNKLPSGPIKLGVRARTQVDGSVGIYYLPMITIYRK